jgi:hypothetical protein
MKVKRLKKGMIVSIPDRQWFIDRGWEVDVESDEVYRARIGFLSTEWHNKRLELTGRRSGGSWWVYPCERPGIGGSLPARFIIELMNLHHRNSIEEAMNGAGNNKG